jgi:hypothetical protein
MERGAPAVPVIFRRRRGSGELAARVMSDIGVRRRLKIDWWHAEPRITLSDPADMWVTAMG